ncbi:MAG: hypothetical protein IKX54_02510 [Lachnospiraceae bacterium]|nr:hypothetical protein [Lachnospiraceae bacterium]
MREVFREARFNNRRNIGWLLLLMCAFVWCIEGGVWLATAAAVAVFCAAIERAKAYAFTPAPEFDTDLAGIGLYNVRYALKGWRSTASFGETLRDKNFNVALYFRRVYLGMLPPIVICVAAFSAVAWRILLPVSAIIFCVACFVVVPILAFFLYGLSVKHKAADGTKGRSRADLISRVATRACSVAVLALMAFRASDRYVSRNLRMAFCWINAREETMIVWKSDYGEHLGKFVFLAILATILAALLFVRRFRLVKTILYFALIIIMLSPHKVCQYGALSIGNIHVREGLFDILGTDYKCKEVANYTITAWEMDETDGIGFQMVFYMNDGSAVDFKWGDYRDEDIHFCQPAQCRWITDAAMDTYLFANERVSIEHGYDIATDALYEKYPHPFSFLEEVVYAFTEESVPGDLVKGNDDTTDKDIILTEDNERKFNYVLWLMMFVDEVKQVGK